MVWDSDKIGEQLRKLPDSLDKQRKQKAIERTKLIYRGILFTLYLIIFVIFALSIKQSDSTCTLGDALRSTFAEQSQVTFKADVWNYLDNTILPLLSGNGDNTTIILGGNSILLGYIEIRQYRYSIAPCSVRDDVEGLIDCVSDSSDPSPFGPTNISLYKLDANPFWGSGYSSGPHNLVLLPNNRSDASILLDELKNFGWIDRATKAIIVLVNIFSLGSNQFGQFGKIFEQDHGVWETNSQFSSITPPDTQTLVTFIIYIGTFIIFEIVYFRQLISYLTHRGIYSTIIAYLFTLSWELVDTILHLFQLVFLALWILFTVEVVSFTKIIDLSKNIDQTESINYLVSLSSTIWAAISCVIILLVMKSFQFFAVNRYTATTFNTMVTAAPHVFALIVVAMFVWLMVSLGGMLILCSNSWLFKNWGTSYFTSWDILTGSIAIQDLAGISPILGPAYYMISTFILSFFLLNMFIGVIGEYYKRAMVDDDTSDDASFEEKFKMRVGRCLGYLCHTSIRNELSPHEAIHLLATKTYQKCDIHEFQRELQSLGVSDEDIEVNLYEYYDEYVRKRYTRDLAGLQKGDLLTLWNLIEEKLDSITYKKNHRKLHFNKSATRSIPKTQFGE
uniref:Uncharacterized protein n=1 Tax=Arcella intermedia TaxID=1963864 RepID=A0A6B2L037_9EUKA